MQRFHSKLIFSLSIAIISVGLSASLPAIAKSSLGIKLRTNVVEGQVFIVTKGQQAIKLALVPVTVLSEQEINRLLSQRSARMNQRRDGIVAELIAEVGKREMRKATIDAKKMELREAGKKTVECALTLSTAAANYKSEFAKCSEKPEMMAARARAEELRSELYDAQALAHAAVIEENISRLLTQYNAGTSINDIHEELARVVPAVTKSDIDGKFSIEVPYGKRFALLAYSSRYVAGSADEHYQWLIWLAAPKPGIKMQIMLANDNLMTSLGCKECVNINDQLTVHPEIDILFRQLAASVRPEAR